MMMFDRGSVFAMGMTAEGGSPLLQVVPFILILGIFYFIILLPSKRRLTELRTAAAAPAAAAAAPQPAFEAIPVALCSCSPVVNAVPGSAATPDR